MPDALRPVRQHRPRQQLAARRPDRPASSATTSSPSPGFGSDMGMEKFFDIVCRMGNLTPERGRARRDRARDQAPRRSATTRARRARLARVGSAWRTCGATSRTSRRSGCRASSASTAAPATPTRSSSCVKRARARGGRVRGRGQRRLRQRRRRRGRARRGRRRGLRAAEHASSSSTTTTTPIGTKIEAVATRIYGATRRRTSTPRPQRKIEPVHARRASAHFPSAWPRRTCRCRHDPTLLNAPEGFTLPVRDIRAYTGAGWLVPLCGDIQQMPGLGKTPGGAQRRHRRRRTDGRAVLIPGRRPRSLAECRADDT